jgi:hypothetical protein
MGRRNLTHFFLKFFNKSFFSFVSFGYIYYINQIIKHATFSQVNYHKSTYYL